MTLQQHLDEHLPHQRRPSVDWVEALARKCEMTTADVWRVVHAWEPPGITHARRDLSPQPRRLRGFDAVVAAFRQHGSTLKPTKKGYVTRCLLHGDRVPSLVINRAPDDSRVALLYCHSCKRKPGPLVAPLGLTAADCFPDDPTARARTVYEVLAEYPYVAMDGTHVATKVRQRNGFHAKGFRWRVGRRWYLSEHEKDSIPLYREQDLIEESTVYLVEGEKAADRLWDAGLPATCGASGAGRWQPRWTESLRLVGAQQVVILVDNDAPGRSHGELVATALYSADIVVRVVDLPSFKLGEDVYDWLGRGGTIEELEAIVAATPAWSPGLAAQQQTDRRRARWREKKQRQREKRRRLAPPGVPLRSSSVTGVHLRSSVEETGPNRVPHVPQSPLRSVSIVTSKGTDDFLDLPSVHREESVTVEGGLGGWIPYRSCGQRTP